MNDGDISRRQSETHCFALRLIEILVEPLRWADLGGEVRWNRFGILEGDVEKMVGDALTLLDHQIETTEEEKITRHYFDRLCFTYCFNRRYVTSLAIFTIMN